MAVSEGPGQEDVSGQVQEKAAGQEDWPGASNQLAAALKQCEKAQACEQAARAHLNCASSVMHACVRVIKVRFSQIVERTHVHSCVSCSACAWWKEAEQKLEANP